MLLTDVADRPFSVPAHRLRHPVEDLAHETRRGGQLPPVQHLQKRDGGNEDAQWWFDEPDGGGGAKGTEESQRSWPVDLYRADTTDEALVFLGHSNLLRASFVS